MKFRICLFAILLVEGVFMHALVRGQSADSTWQNIDYTKYTNAWLSSGHVLGLHALPVPRLSIAELNAGKNKGGFVNFYESDDRFRVGAKVSSYRKMNARVAFLGGVEYESSEGKNMGGSAFIDPAKYPLDIDEYADSTAGKKKLERYNLVGGLTTQLGSRWRLGGRVNYEAANYTKFRDMRHTNKLLQLDAYLGGSYTVNDHLEVGLGYGYLRRIESVKFGIYGNTDRQYLSLINFGSFYGTVELHDEKGYTADNNPLVDLLHKASAFANVTLGPRASWFNELNFGVRNGYFGQKGTTGITYTEHAGSQYAYHGVAVIQRTGMLHHLDLRVAYQALENQQNIYRLETPQGGSSSIVYYGQSQVLDQKIRESSLHYSFHSGKIGWVPKWIFNAGVNYRSRTQQVSLYPYFRKQEINSYHLSAAVTQNRQLGQNLFTISYQFLTGGGNGTAQRDGLYAKPSNSQNTPGSKASYLNREFEYLTASRIENTVKLRYTYRVKAGQQTYLQLHYSNTNAFKVIYLQKNVNTVSATLGYTF
jgi:hypothetical protein